MEMTLAKFVIISILCNLLNIGSCCPGLPTSVGTITPDQTLEVGQTIYMNCNLDDNKILLKNRTIYVNSSMLVLKFNKTYLTKNVRIVNSNMIEFRKENATFKDIGRYYCFLDLGPNFRDKKTLVCATGVNVGYKPLPVANFSCTSWHYKNLTCSWNLRPNPIKTEYVLEDYIILYDTNATSGVTRLCPKVLSETSCQWEVTSDTPYRKHAEKINLRLTGMNVLGNNSENFEINHYARVLPSVPKNFKIQTVTENSVSVAWLPPEEMSIEGDFRPGLTFQLQYKSEYSDTWDFITINKTKQAQLVDLNPYTFYTLKLRCRSTVAYTDDMWSNFTTDVVRTKTDIPYVAPETIQGLFEVRNFQGGRNITIHWNPIPKKNWNGENFHYIIHCYETHISIPRFKREMNSKWKNETRSSVTFTDMNNTIDYVFIIKTANSKGISDVSSKIEVNKKENLLPSPKNIKVTDYGSGMYEIAWSMPNHSNPIIDNYTVFWCEAIKSRPFPCVGPFQWRVFPKNSTFAQLNLSDADTNYQFAISSNSRLSSSGLEWVPCIIPHNGVLNKIEKVSLQTVNSTSLLVLWYLDCNAQKNAIKAYHIYCYESINSTITELAKTIILNNSQAESCVISGLKPYTSYGVVMAAATSGGISEPSDYKFQKTNPGAPWDSPRDVSIISKNDTTIELTFYPPSIRNGVISNYDIYIMSEDGSSKHKSFSFHDHRYSATIDELIPYTNYTIEVKACVQHECSPSSILYAMTDIGVPGIMEPPIPEVYNSTFVQLSWTHPQQRNGPIDFYTLHIQWEENDEIQNQSINIYDHTHYDMNVECPFRDKDTLYSFSVQAANIKNGNVLFGNKSNTKQTNLCYISDGFNLSMILGMICGGTFGLVALIVVLYTLARWMKKKVDRIKEIKVQLPPGLESPHCNSLNSYENFKNGLIRKASESNLSPQTLYGRLSSCASDENEPKDPPDSDASQFSNNSTEELLYKKNGQSGHGGHSNGDGNTGKGHDSISSSLTNRTQLSSDSGAETDVLPPPSPESDNGQGLPHSSPQPQNKSLLPKVDEAHSSDSKDSGLEKEEGGNEKESSSNHYSRFVCYLDNPQHPYNQRKLLERPPGTQQLPYSKFGVNMPGVSDYIPLVNSLVFMRRSLANSEPSVVDAEKIKEKDQEITADIVAPPYSKYGLARSYGEALNMPVCPEIYMLNNGYSKCGVSSNIPCLENTAANLSTPVIIPNSTYQDVQLTEQSKANNLVENTKSLPLSPSWTPCPKNNGYVTVDKLTNPSKTTLTQPVDGTAYSRLGTKPEVGTSTCQSKGYISVQDAKDMLSGKEKTNDNESKEHLMGIPGYSKFDIQCDRLDSSSDIETVNPIVTGTKPKIYSNSVRQGYVPYCGFNDATNEYMYNKNPNFEVKGQNLNNSVIFPMEEDNGNITANISPTKYLAQPKVHEPKNGYVQINPDISPDSIKIVPNDTHLHSSLTDTAV